MASKCKFPSKYVFANFVGGIVLLKMNNMDFLWINSCFFNDYSRFRLDHHLAYGE